MPTPVLRLATLLIGLSGPPGSLAELPTDAEVVAESLAAHVEPDATSFAPERLRKGAKIRVVDADPATGWLTIEPTALAFDWIERTSVRRDSSTTGEVIAPSTTLRVGIAGARLPGPPTSPLKRGVSVHFLDKPALILGTGKKATSWLAVVPEQGEVRYVRPDGVAWPKSRPVATQAIRASFDAPKSFAEKPLPPEIAEIEAEHRAILSGRVASWQLAPVRERYESLLKQVNDHPEATEAIRARLDLVARHEEISLSARTFQTLLDRSRRLDQGVAKTLSQLARRDAPTRRPFTAEGLIQPASQLVEGRRVYALIGVDGEPVAYLDVPPGLDARFAVTKRVGVRGTVHYNENLGTRLIAVKDLEPLE